jgi:hypothetical protein
MYLDQVHIFMCTSLYYLFVFCGTWLVKYYCKMIWLMQINQIKSVDIPVIKNAICILFPVLHDSEVYRRFIFVSELSCYHYEVLQLDNTVWVKNVFCIHTKFYAFLSAWWWPKLVTLKPHSIWKNLGLINCFHFQVFHPIMHTYTIK